MEFSTVIEDILEFDFSKSIPGIIGFFLAVWFYRQIDKASPNKKDREGKPLPSKNVFDAIEDIWDDKSFIKDFAKILADEGNFEEIEKQIIDSSLETVTYEKELWDKVDSPNYRPPSISKRIVEKLMSTDSYKKLARKYKFQKNDEVNFAKLLYITISKPDFSEVAKTYIFQTAKKGIFSIHPKIPAYKLYGYGSG